MRNIKKYLFEQHERASIFLFALFLHVIAFHATPLSNIFHLPHFTKQSFLSLSLSLSLMQTFVSTQGDNFIKSSNFLIYFA
jgi:hypothetical protein